MHGSILLVTNPPSPPRQPSRQVHPFGPGGGELFEVVLSWGKGGGANKKYLVFDFAKFMLFPVWFT